MHLDEAFAAKSIFKRRMMHGMLVALKSYEQGAKIVLTNSHFAFGKGGIEKLVAQLKSEAIPKTK